jgi:hypothetical protein
LSDAIEIYNESAIAPKEIGLEINTNKTKLLIHNRRASKHNLNGGKNRVS